jgi:calcium/calmodulin-dependent 3',5'-cyclic nucleotide phosphodiesterase
VAHPAKPWDLHRRWSDMITEEFFRQGDAEAAEGFPISPLCDRTQKVSGASLIGTQ